jgi:hypothetical protein
MGFSINLLLNLKIEAFLFFLVFSLKKWYHRSYKKIKEKYGFQGVYHSDEFKNYARFNRFFFQYLDIF